MTTNEPTADPKEDLGPEEELTAVPYEMWWWDCPGCGDTNDARDVEPSGPEVCEHCNLTVVVRR